MKQIVLTRGKVAIVDDEDFERLSQFEWYFDNGRAARNDKMIGYSRGKRILMHRFILHAQNGQLVDHIDQNPLNNQKSNLRFADKSINGLNRGKNINNKSGYKGVSWFFNKKKNWGRWVAQKMINGKKIFLGYYNSPQDAHEAYLKGEKL